MAYENETASAVGADARAYDRRPAGIYTVDHARNMIDQELAQQHIRAKERSAENSAEGPLANIRRRIAERTNHAKHLADQLEFHANRVLGHEPEQEPDTNRTADGGIPHEPPMLESIFHALNELDRVFAVLTHQVERNTVLA